MEEVCTRVRALRSVTQSFSTSLSDPRPCVRCHRASRGAGLESSDRLGRRSDVSLLREEDAAGPRCRGAIDRRSERSESETKDSAEGLPPLDGWAGLLRRRFMSSGDDDVWYDMDPSDVLPDDIRGLPMPVLGPAPGVM